MSVSRQSVVAIHIRYESEEPRPCHHYAHGIFTQPTKRHLQLLVWWRGAVKLQRRGGEAERRNGGLMGTEGSGFVTHLPIECDVEVARCRPTDESGTTQAKPPTTGRIRRASRTPSPPLLTDGPVVGALGTVGIENALPIVEASGYSLCMVDARVPCQAMHERYEE